MEYREILMTYIDNCPYDEPIFIEEIKEYLKDYIKNNFDNVSKKFNVYINRLVKENILVQIYKGIYYKPLKGLFGYKKINLNKIIYKKYIKNEYIKGYYSGAYLFNKIGLTTQVPKDILIVTNECPNNNDYVNKYLGVTIRKPKLEINELNYKYLQLFDLLINKDKIKIEVDNEKDIIYNFIYENNLMMEKIFDYAKKVGNTKIILKLYELGDETNE